MYACQENLQGLGFSLKPPAWLRSLGSKVVSAIKSNVRVSVPTPAGTITVDPNDPDSLRRAQEILRGARVEVGAPAPSPAQQAASMVESIPGGWLTVAAIGTGLMWLATRGSRR